MSDTDGEDLSIVVQGRLNAADAAQTAHHCRHWRDDFPGAELILAVSESDLFGAERTTPEALRAAGDCSGVAVAGALRALSGTVDRVVHAQPEAALAPLKFGGAPNHVNLQIAAAQSGLAAATRLHTLRVRSDLTLVGPIIDHYARSREFAPAATILSQRVMICQLFTLNPYTAERLPFHYSDWFQLGATADLRAMWGIGRYDAADATYYSSRPHARYSTPSERQFQSRYAAEQFIALEYFRRHDRTIVVDFHNDLLGRRRGMDILFGEFVIADPQVCRINFPKYHHVIDHPFSDLLCVSHEDWRQFAEVQSHAGYQGYFRGKAERLAAFPHGYG